MAGVLIALLGLAGGLRADGKDDKGWIVLFNGKDTTGWKLRAEKISVTKYVDAEGKEIPGAKKAKLDQKEVARDAKNKDLPDAKIETRGGKKVVVDADGQAILGAKVAKVGGRDALVDAKGQEITGAKAVTQVVPNPSGWTVENGDLISSKPHHGNDLLTEQKFTDFELHIEFQATSNSGVYLQGRYEIQIDNSYKAKPKIVEKNGEKVEVFDSHQCGAIYGRIAPSKNMARPPKEWQSYDVRFRGARGDKGKVTQKARVTLVWNGEKVIDDAEIDGPTGGALDGRVTESGPLLLQGDHGRVAFRNIKIRPLTTAAAPCCEEEDVKTEEGYTSLFNGKDLTGWRYTAMPKVSLEGQTETPDGRIKVENGLIVMNEKDAKGKGGIRDLYTVQSFPKNFNLKLEFRAALKADSGVYLRGPQLQVRDFIRRGEHKHLKKFQNDGWNELDITLTNGVPTTVVNGKTLTAKDLLEVTVKEGKPQAQLNGKAVDIKSITVNIGAVAQCLCNGEKLETMRNLPANGGIGLQAETGKFEFRNIRVKELP
jgi:hypothetical protein